MINKRTIALVIFTLSVILLTACIGQEEIEETIEIQEEVISVPEEKFYSGWIPYWDYIAARNHLLEQEIFPTEVVAFGAFFQGSEVYMPVETEEVLLILEESKPMETEVYLSFINDIKLEDGTFVQKDKSFLEEQLATEDTRATHMERILDVALQYNIQGIEIDYENIRSDSQLWELYGLFLEELQVKCNELSLKLRAVIPYDAVKYTTLPTGPHYVVMCYNLYGTHSGAGPKANQEFLDTSFELNQVLQPNVSMAFSNNGFSWSDEGDVTAVTKTQASEKALWVSAEECRDEDSQAVYYSYTDNDNISHEVWYADDTTLDYWMKWATQAGYQNHALWRYGD